MELAKVEQLLEAYFEGNTSLVEENQLRDYFNSKEVAPHLAGYTALFVGFSIAREETSSREIEILTPTKNRRFFNWSIAASVALLLGVGAWYFNNGTGLSQEEQEALMAYNEAKQTMLLLSESLNKGTAPMEELAAFGEGAASLNIINQFTETKQRILK